MSGQTVQVSIINDSRVEGCEVACGIDWSDSQELRLAVQRVAEKFGAGVKVAFIDLAESGVSPEILKWGNEIKNRELSLPLLVLNDHLRMAGNFDIRQLMDIIEIETEMET